MSKKRFTLRLSRGLVSDIDRVAEQRGESRTMVIEHALASYLERLEDRQDRCYHHLEENPDTGRMRCVNCGAEFPLRD